MGAEEEPSRRTFWIALSLALITGAGVITLALHATQLQKSALKNYTTHSQAQNYTYLGDDYPAAWPIPPLERVHMSLENTIHYAFDTPQGRAEWATVLPSGGAVVRLGPERRAFTVGMFHQLRCLGIVREVLAALYSDARAPVEPTRRQMELARHCMGYLRQMVLCAADLRLETVRAAQGGALTAPEVTHTCLDWEMVYRAAEENYVALFAVERLSERSALGSALGSGRFEGSGT